MSAILRFIPTRVGNTYFRPKKPRKETVHPHASGEHFFVITSDVHITGSSPREWGTPLNATGQIVLTRFIPTRVGNTQGTTPVIALYDGSSPREWGTPRPATSSPMSSRFIPTRVGNTEHYRGRPAKLYGSSPREWGTHAWNSVTWSPERFIPTRVGNTAHVGTIKPPRTVHPHASGEH